MSNNIVPGSFVAVSDFHGNSWPFDKVEKYYLNEYEKIFILGDATDRGKNGEGAGSMELLLNIKNLADKYPGRVFYIPGNHDQFLYEYATYDDDDAERLLLRNGGETTINEYERLRRGRYSAEVDSLINWLGKLPLQKEHVFDGKKYVFAHAFFNQRLYDSKPNFSLDDLYRCKIRDSKMYDYLSNIVWFRKGKDSYHPGDLPKDGSVMVIGHTPLTYREGQNLDLENANGDMVKVHCVDGGVVYDGRMLKYDGGQETISTDFGSHMDTSPKDVKSQIKEMDFDIDKFNEDIDLLDEVIVDVMKNSSNKKTAYLTLQKLYLTGDTSELSKVGGLNIRAKELNPEIIKNIVRVYAGVRDGKVDEQNLDELYFDYVEDISFEHVVTSLNKRFGSVENTTGQIIGLFQEGHYGYITESVGKARTVASNLGIDTMKKVIKKNGYTKVSDYVASKSANSYGASK